MAPKPEDDIPESELVGEDPPDEEEEFLEEMGLGADGTRMQIGDTDLTGRPWQPDRDE